jgi:glutamate-1-semialdehyde 2,1-aminomutase
MPPLSPSFENSEKLFAHAQTLMPAGVSSPVRAFRKVGGSPVMMKRGEGAFLFDEDGHRYVDFCMAWGPLILGHAHPAVVEAVQKAAADGLSFGTCHKKESQLAELVLEAIAPDGLVRFVVSGTEAVLTATRLARAFTKRPKLLKFAGCYHGHVDSLLVKAGSGLVTQGLAESAGVSEVLAAQTVVIPLGDIEALREAFARFGSEIAAAIVEPLPANNGLLIQDHHWLRELRKLTQEHHSLLIFDEVITGFRLGFHGYAKVCDVVPDLTTLGKIVGGGLPVGALVGRRDVMSTLAPLGPVYQAGTMAGNPVALSAGLATLYVLKTQNVYRHLEQLGTHLEEKLAHSVLSKRLRLVRVGSILWPYFEMAGPLPKETEQISKSAVNVFHAGYRRCLEMGVYLPPSAFEVGFLSAAHTTGHIDLLLETLNAAMVAQ